MKLHHPATLPVIGWRERVSLPALGITRIVAKTDTGARNSALHAFSITEFQKGGAPWVRFGVHPKRKNNEHEIWCEAAVADTRTVRSSGGHDSHRYFIATELVLHGMSFEVLLSLADRDKLGNRMLLGRTAIAGRFLVDAKASYLLSRKHGRKGRR
jgi:hypothetical protein